jgi:hypothetical protein
MLQISMATVNHIESLNERYSTLMKKLLDQPTKRRNAGGRGSARFMTTAGGKLAEQQQAKHKQQMECMNRYVKMLGGFVKSTPEGSVNGVEQQSLTPVYSDLTALSSTSAIFQAQIAVDDEEDDFDALQAELEVEGQSSIARVTASRTPVPAQAPSLQTEQLHAIPIKKTAPTKPKAGTLQQSSDKKKKSNTIEVSSDSDDALAELENELSASIGTELASVPEPIVLAPTTIRKSARRRANPIRNKSSKNAKSDDNEGDELLLALEEELQAAGRDFTSTTKTRVNTAGTQSTISNITKKTPRRSITQKNGVATTENTKSNTTRSGRQIVRPSTEVKRRRTRKQVVNSTRSSDVTKILPQEVSTPSKTSQDSETDDDTLLAALEQELETTPTLVTPLPVSTRTRSGSLPPANFEIEEEDDDEMAALEAELNSII